MSTINETNNTGNLISKVPGANEINYVNAQPIITKIRIGNTHFDICAPKDWSENQRAHRNYIANRTHYKEKTFYVTSDADINIKVGYVDTKLGSLVQAMKIVESSHSFANTYTREGVLLTADCWQVHEPWFDPKCWTNYKYVLKIGESEIVGTIPKNGIEIEFGGGIVLSFDSRKQEFRLKGEDSVGDGEGPDKTGHLRSIDNKVVITPKPTCTACIKAALGAIIGEYQLAVDEFESLPVEDQRLLIATCLENSILKKDSENTSENTSESTSEKNLSVCKEGSCSGVHLYELTHKLNADYLPIDNFTILKDANGVISTDSYFTDDFRVSSQFGKYSPASWVSAKNKTLRQVIVEAYCEDFQPAIVNNPYCTLDIKMPPTDLESTYEIGSTVELEWALKLCPGKYSYGTNSGRVSNLYAVRTSIGGYYVENGDKRITEASIDDSWCYTKADDIVDYSGNVVEGTPLANSYDETKETYSFGWDLANTSKLSAAHAFALKKQDEKDETDPYTLHYAKANYDKMPIVIATGTLKVNITQEGSNGQATASVKLFRDDTDCSVSSLGEQSKDNKGDVIIIPVNWDKDADSTEQPGKYDDDIETKQPKSELFGSYRWFCGYRTVDNGLLKCVANENDTTIYKVKEATSSADFDFRNFYSADSANCLLDRFPKTITTKKMQQLWFAAPKGKLDIKSFRVFNARTGANAGLINKNITIKVKDASENEQNKPKESLYDLFYVDNAEADSGTNTYEIYYERAQEGGNS